MKGIISQGVILILLFFTGVLSAQEPKGPRIEVTQGTYNIGSVAQGTQAVHVFDVRNAGTEPLMIESLKPS
jgi:hypothetical protein